MITETRPGSSVKGKLFIVSAPSGAGKTTLCKALRKRFPQLAYSVSYTTRPSRKGEEDGKDYFFITEEQFSEKLKTGKWAEWAKVHGNYYGTCAEDLDRFRNAGQSVLLDIDVEGAIQIKNHYPDSIAVFIMPPSLVVLENRLRSRGTDDEEAVRKRMNHARAEIGRRDMYDHIIVNDRLDDAVEAFTALINRYIKEDAPQTEGTT
jgi:guanylate kinase